MAFKGNNFNFNKKSIKGIKNNTKVQEKSINNKKDSEDNITNWIYMTPIEINAKMIADLFKTKTELVIDIWEDLGIVEVELADKSLVDFEPMYTDFKDPSDAAFVKNRNIKTIFAVTIDEGAFEELKTLMKLVIEELDGFLCADSVDFNPIFDRSKL